MRSIFIKVFDFGNLSNAINKVPIVLTSDFQKTAIAAVPIFNGEATRFRCSTLSSECTTPFCVFADLQFDNEIKCRFPSDECAILWATDREKLTQLLFA